jgi:CheY-like chemotaxis protein
MARPLSVLLVDDNSDGTDSLLQILRLHGYEVRGVYTSSAGLAAAAERMPDVLISDIGMPKFDGCELAIRVAALDGIVPLMIAVTGHSDIGERCRIAGFDHFFVKPADPRLIEAVLRQHGEQLDG